MLSVVDDIDEAPLLYLFLVFTSTWLLLNIPISKQLLLPDLVYLG